MLYCVCIFSHMFVYLSPDRIRRSQRVCGCLCPAGSECCIVFVFSHTCLFICLQIGSAEASVYVDAFALQEVNVVLCLCFLTHVCLFVSRSDPQKPACMWMPLPCRK